MRSGSKTAFVSHFGQGRQEFHQIVNKLLFS